MSVLCVSIIAIISCFIGIAVGRLLKAKTKQQVVGTIWIEQIEPNEAPYLFSELYYDIPTLCKQKTVIFEVKNRTSVPQT